MLKELDLPEIQLLDSSFKITNEHESAIQNKAFITQRMLKNPKDTFYFEADNDHMRFYGIYKGAIVIVDQSIPVVSGKLIVCCVNEEWLIRKLVINGMSTFFCINDHMDACLNITGRSITIIGAVTWTCSPQLSEA